MPKFYILVLIFLVSFRADEIFFRVVSSSIKLSETKIIKNVVWREKVQKYRSSPGRLINQM